LNSRRFVQRVRKYDRRLELDFDFDPRTGKGSHGRIWLGERLTTVKQGELSKGLVRKMLRDLDIRPEDF
jgi:mRNA interferase HicA